MSRLPEELAEILKDNTSGSKELLLKLNNYFLSFPNTITPDLLLKLRKEFNQFSTIENYIEKLHSLVISGESPIEFLKEINYRESKLPEILISKLKPYLEGKRKIITLSNSKTLTDVFLLMKERNFDFEITVSESRPANEGLVMAQKLADAGIKVTLITDAMLGTATKSADIGIIGADKILKDNSVVNKTGSFTLAVVLKYLSKPLIVLADKSKISNETSFTPKLYPPEEITKIQKSMMYVTNYYFERVDETLITTILTD